MWRSSAGGYDPDDRLGPLFPVGVNHSQHHKNSCFHDPDGMPAFLTLLDALDVLMAIVVGEDSYRRFERNPVLSLVDLILVFVPLKTDQLFAYPYYAPGAAAIEDRSS